MAVYTLENDYLVVTVDAHGAEVISVISKITGEEYMWNGDVQYWNRHSPILFPFVGSNQGKKFRYEGKEYPMPQHGFARDMDFELIGREDEKLVFSLKSNEKALEVYPFLFVLDITYVLKKDQLEVIWDVKNQDKKPMYFQIGAHPGFLCRMDKKEDISDFIAFHGVDKLRVREIDMKTGLASNKFRSLSFDAIVNGVGYLRLKKSLFDNDALVLEDRQCNIVQLCHPDKTPYITVDFDTPLFGVWAPSKRSVPFVCIEPWFGRCDGVDFHGNIEEKEYINVLEMNGVFQRSYTIRFGS